MKKLIFTAALALSVASLQPASAFMTIQESNELTPQGQFKVGIEPQIRLSNGTAMNFTGYLDTYLNDEMSARAVVGTGDIDFLAGASLKWVPFPDYANQPSVGVKVGGYVWREEEKNFFTLQLAPIVSKKLQGSTGTWIPYAGLPLMFNSGPDLNTTGIQLAGGTEYIHNEADNMTFGAELGADVKDSFSYISGYVTIYLDETRPSQP